MVDAVVQLAVVIKLVLPVDFSAPFREHQVASEHGLVKVKAVQGLLGHCGVERRQDQ